MEPTSTTDLLGLLNSVELKYAPPRLWTRGDVGLLQHHPRVAVIGTRRPSKAGEQRTRQLVRELVRGDAIIVSGLAEGVDTIAHTCAIARGGRTIAVLGTPLDVAYPRRNANLQARIGAEHLLLSEFTPGSPVAKGNFPRRNRTMALIADASVIIEAGETSGTVSQGWEAIRLGRPLFLLRSLVESGLKWPKEMIDHGAFILESPRIDELRDVLPCGPALESVPF